MQCKHWSLERGNHVDALALAAHHKIEPWVELFLMSQEGLTEAPATLDAGRMRYRAVLSTEVEGGQLM